MGNFCINFEGTVGERGVESLEVRKLEGTRLDLTAGLFCVVLNLSAGFDVDENKLIDVINEGIKFSESGLFKSMRA